MDDSLSRLTKFVVEAVQDDMTTPRHELAMRKQILNVALSLRHTVCGDSWYTCPQATHDREGDVTSREDVVGEPCECHVDDTQQRLFTVLATMYGDRPGARDILSSTGRNR
jgi:hypothetical protein